VLGCSVCAYLDKGSDILYHPEKVKLRLPFSSRPPVAHNLLFLKANKEQTEGKQGATEKTVAPIKDYLSKGVRRVKGKTRRALKIVRGFPAFR
jgi:hypothetical protein